ncbi:hypothetical protein C5167_026506 [Papaver somniferum]|nr:hypothetical protein C5167_026506 [Papaver somniferum]
MKNTKKKKIWVDLEAKQRWPDRYDALKPREGGEIYHLWVRCHIKPKFTLMENVVDGTLGRYAMCRLVAIKYQKLRQFPLPMHKDIARGFSPKQSERNVVKGDEEYTLQLKDDLLLKDAIYDLPEVSKLQCMRLQDEQDYGNEILRQISRGLSDYQSRPYPEELMTLKLYDHRPLKLIEDDNLRVSQIPRENGANFRNLPGVVIDEKNKARPDPKIKKVIIPDSGKPLVPEYAIKFVRGTSKK